MGVSGFSQVWWWVGTFWVFPSLMVGGSFQGFPKFGGGWEFSDFP